MLSKAFVFSVELKGCHRYTKAMDSIKAIRKEQTAEIKVDKERLLALKTDRERSKKVRHLPS